MYVVATAGHVDHGKSTLVRALTGMDPDRLAEEHRRGLTLDLGFAWTALPDGERLAFVDVPGHERFVATMLAGVGPVQAVLLVVAADEGWRQQSSEHLAAIDALGIRHGLLVVTRSDLGDSRGTTDDVVNQARRHIVGTSFGNVRTVPVSAVSGKGMPELREALSSMAAGLPAADRHAPVRFWVDRSFTVRGAGTVVTGTLTAGSVTQGDILTLRDFTVTVRQIQVANSAAPRAEPVSRVALNLRDVPVSRVGRGDVLWTPNAFRTANLIDVRIEDPGRLPQRVVFHLGTAGVSARLRPLGKRSARVRLDSPLPLRAGDRAVLRDPGAARAPLAGSALDQDIAGIAGAVVLDADPPGFTHRGDARRRGEVLDTAPERPNADAEVARRGAVLRDRLQVLGVDTSPLSDTAGWLVSDEQRADWLRGIRATFDDWSRQHPLSPSIPRAVLRTSTGIPEALLDELVRDSGMETRGGAVAPPGRMPTLGASEAAVDALLTRLSAAPFDAPDRDELRRLGLGRRELAAAERLGRLLRIGDDLVLAPRAPQAAAALLAELPAPFTLSAARQALDTTRRVAVPLLEYLDSIGVTERLTATTRRVIDNRK